MQIRAWHIVLPGVLLSLCLWAGIIAMVIAALD